MVIDRLFGHVKRVLKTEKDIYFQNMWENEIDEIRSIIQIVKYHCQQC